MTPSRSLGRPIAAILTVLSLAACTSTPAPSTRPSASIVTAVGPTGPSTAPSVAPDSTASPITTATPEPAESPGPTAEPTIDPTPFPNPTTRPTSAAAASCGTGEAGYTAAHETPQTLQFGGATIEFTGAGVGMLDGSWNADDVIPGGIGLTRNEIAVAVGPGDHIILRAKGLTLLGTSAAASSWAMVSFGSGLANLAGAKTTLPWRFRPDGSLSISAPEQAGDWAIEFVPNWEGACTHGDGTAYARIKVK